MSPVYGSDIAPPKLNPTITSPDVKEDPAGDGDPEAAVDVQIDGTQPLTPADGS